MPQGESTLAHDLPDAMRILATSRVAGSLRIKGTGGQAHFAIADGKILFASSSRSGPLGRALVEKGLITSETLRGVLRLQQNRRHAQPIGTILYDLGLISGKAADEEIALHIASVVREVLAWDSGTFEFHQEPVQNTGVIASECLELERILLQVRLMNNP